MARRAAGLQRRLVFLPFSSQARAPSAPWAYQMRPRHTFPTVHSEYVHNTVARLWSSTDMSASEIGAQLQLTRNSVIALMNRLGHKLGLLSREAFKVAWHAPQATSTSPRERLEQGAVLGSRLPKPETVGRSNHERQGRRRKGFRTEAMLKAKAPSPVAALPPLRDYDLRKLGSVEGELKSLFDLKHGECRAVMAEHPRLPGGMYCAAPVKLKSSYCPEHHQLYYVPVKSTKRERKRKLVPGFVLRPLGTGVRV